MMPTPRRLAPLCLVLALAAACDDAEPSAPSESESGAASIAIALQFANAGASAAGLQEAYLKTNRLWLQFRDASSARDERQIDFRPSQQESHVPLLIRLRRPRESMQFNVEVRLGTAGVFRGTAPVTLRAGRLTSVTATLFPILAGVRAPDSVPVLTAWGDTVKLAAAGILATGDTIQGVFVRWRSLDPAVARVDTVGTVVGVNDGTARMVATADAFADTAIVRVQAGVATILVTPGGNSVIPLRGTLQLKATLLDSRGNVLPPRPVTWTSAGPTTITVGPTGVATAVGIGTTQIRAAIGTVSSTISVTGVPIAPQTDSLKALVTGTTTATLKALVIPNGAATQSSFEWGSTQVTIPPSVLLPQPVGAGLLAVPVSTTLTSLRPNTLYYALVRASNPVGSAVSDTVWFTTGNPGSGSGAPSVITEGWTTIQPGWAVLIGSVDAWNAAAEAWFEWGTDPTLKTSQKTPLQNVSGSGRITVTAPVQVTVGTTYFFRFVARNSSGTSSGAILSLTLGTPQEPTIISTGPVTNVTHNGATLNGSVIPNGLPTTAWFDWGTSPTLATFTSSPPQSLGSGFTSVGFSFDLIALAPNTTYYFRLNAGNSAGTSTGPIFSFTTLPDPNVDPPAVSTDAPTVVLEEPVQLNGTVNPNGAATTAWFEWGASPSLSSFVATPEQAVGSGTAAVAFSASLPPGTTGYYYRAVARNAGGTIYGAIIPF